MEDKKDNIDLATYNQAGYGERRKDEGLTRVDRLSINPFLFNQDTNAWNYEIIFNDLKTILLTISPKLKPDELTTILKLKETIRGAIRYLPIFTTAINITMKGKEKSNRINYQNRDTITDLLFLFRLNIEKLMDKHGFGNPSKEDPTKAIIQN